MVGRHPDDLCLPVAALQHERGSCSDLSGATQSTYVVASGDVGFTPRVRVTVTNSAGQASQQSSPTAVVTAVQPPVNTAEPAISGAPRQGETVAASTGTWSGSQPITFSNHWVRCPTRRRWWRRRRPLPAVQFFVRARKPGENVLAGVSTRRLIQVRTARPSRAWSKGRGRPAASTHGGRVALSGLPRCQGSDARLVRYTRAALGRASRSPGSSADRNRSASRAAMQPDPAAVTACRYTRSWTSPAAKTPGTLVAVEPGRVTR